MNGRAALRKVAAVAAAGAALVPAGAAAQVPLPPLPGVPPPGGQPPPDGGRPSPQPQPQPQPPGPVSPAPGSVTIGVDVAHTGFFPDDALVPPLTARWSVKGEASALLAADGRVYAIARGHRTAYDQRDGKLLWSLTEGGVGAAYDGGIIFATQDGTVRAYSAADGHELWHHTYENQPLLAAPVASGGVVYVVETTSPWTLYALRASDGGQLWKQPVGDASTPALGDQRLFVSGYCGKAAAYDRASGKQVWQHSSGCSGSGYVPALEAGRLWVPSDDQDPSNSPGAPIFDASNGQVVRHYSPAALPVFVDGLALLDYSDELTALAADSGAAKWKRKLGDLSSLIAVGHDVYGLRESSGRVGGELVGLDAETGRTIMVARRFLANTSFGSGPQSIAAAPGLLLVHAGGRTTAWQSALRPAPKGIAIGTSQFDVRSDRLWYFAGVLGSGIRDSKPRVALEGAGWHRGRFYRFGGLKPARDGGFLARVRSARNTRIRVSAAGAHSNVLTIFVYPRLHLGRPRGTPQHAVLKATVSARGVRFGGHRLVLYYQRRGKGRLTRLGAGRLHGARRGRASASIAFRPPRNGSSRDFVYHCVVGQLRLELGRPSPLTRRCGARVLKRP